MRSDLHCLQHLASVVNSSASLIMKPFVHHLRGMNGILFFLNRFKYFRGISKYHHFLFISVSGVTCIFGRVSPAAEEERISLIKPNVVLNDLLTSMPNIFNSGGLSEERKLYSVIQTCTIVLQ